VRHPAAFVASLRKAEWPVGFKTFLKQPELMRDWLYPYEQEMRDPPQDFVGKAALLWVCIYHVLLGSAERHPEWQVRRLEDISENPLDIYGEIYNDLGLPYTEAVRQGIREHTSESNAGQTSCT
jgi:hypothetical protein